jgi:hypothetical protein
MVQANAFASPTWLVKCEKNIDYAGYTERFRNLQARHLNALSFERLGRLIDSEIITANYKALICWVICAKEFGKKPV